MKEMRLKTRVGKVIDTQIATKEMKPPVNSDQINIQQAEKEFFAIIENVSVSSYGRVRVEKYKRTSLSLALSSSHNGENRGRSE